MTETHPLLQRLVTSFGCTPLAPADLDDFCEAPGAAVLFCGGDPVRYPECLDLAVILPEILRAFPGQLRAGVVHPALETALQARFGFARWPSLVVLRDGGYVGAVSGIQDWQTYLARIAELLAAPATASPSGGIAVACH